MTKETTGPNGGLAKELIDRLKSTHGEDLFRYQAELGGALVFRRPRGAEWHRFTDEASSDSKRASRHTAMKKLTMACFVYPETDDGEPDFSIYHAAIERQPGIIPTVAGELSDMAGASDTADVGKL